MKARRLLFLVMAICLASGVKAQFYDSADEICYFVEYKELYEETDAFGNGTGIIKSREPEFPRALVFNFDGKKAAELNHYCAVPISSVKDRLETNPNYYEEEVERSDYDWIYVSSSSEGVIYQGPCTTSSRSTVTHIFSHDRKTLIKKLTCNLFSSTTSWYYFKRVDKGYFKKGRSRTPSSGIYE